MSLPISEDLGRNLEQDTAKYELAGARQARLPPFTSLKTYALVDRTGN